ncbi:LysR family transcriptional regulator [uncultured Massilia sp.]|uniref:LysR family transcriptional regulator n=1 Tax=uncultured Massilia sp. TaxID=169973 RepID=UPI0027D9AE12|nr:LysR family transcriptional regulator [uncultured Massilia sp.]
MKIRNLQDLEIFVATAEQGGLSAAARLLDISPAVASAGLKRLEAGLDTALFVRTTRSMRLTAAGERLLARGKPLLEGLRDAEDELVAGHDKVEGQLQISMPSDLGRHVVLPWLNAFQARHPAVRLRLQLTDRLADIYREPVDIALRFGKPPESSMVALPLLEDNPRVLCAAPAYLARRGTPATPRELVAHNCLCFMLDDAVNDRWRFRKDDEDIEVAVRGDRVAGDSEIVRRWALDGLGLCYRSLIDVRADLAGGRLRLVCPDWKGNNVPLYMVLANRRQVSPAVRVLREFLVEKVRALAGP